MNFIKKSENDRGLILIVSLWVLVLITLLSLGLAHRVLIHMRLIRHQRDRIKLLYIAKAAIQQGRAILENYQADNKYMLNELWSCGLDFNGLHETSVFQGRELKEGGFTAGYIFDDTNRENPRILYGMSDENRKININIASRQRLICLFEIIFPEITDISLLADALIYWRGDGPEGENSYYERQGYSARRGKIRTIEELNSVEGFREEPGLLPRCRQFLTVYNETGRINVNTASLEVLRSIFMELGAENIGYDLSRRLADGIVNIRNGLDGEAGTIDDVPISEIEVKSNGDDNILLGSANTAEERNWIKSNAVHFSFTDRSDFFTIDVKAKLNRSAMVKNVYAVIEKEQENSTRVVYWHEK